jgi:nicotinamide-nucleotide adenylyltransferase
MVKRAVFVGRFQPFHKGHLEVIKKILDKIDEVIIVVGSSQHSHEPDNPFLVGERIAMIRLALDEEGIQPSRYWIIPVPDVHVHMVWVAQVVGHTPKFDVVYSNDPITRRLFIENGFKVEKVSFIERDIYSATEIRRRITSGEQWEELVPRGVVRFITEIGGVERLRELSKSDKI